VILRSYCQESADETIWERQTRKTLRCLVSVDWGGGHQSDE